MSGAILVVDSESTANAYVRGGSVRGDSVGAILFDHTPAACVEILGRSVLERTVQKFFESGAERVSVLVDKAAAESLPIMRGSYPALELVEVDDCLAGLSKTLEFYSASGVENAFIQSASIYSDCDYLDFKEFHRSRRQAITRAFDRQGTLDLWLVDCSKVQQLGISHLLSQNSNRGSSYCIREYMNRLTEPADVRRLVVDAFRRRCDLRPEGSETRAGVWVEEDTDIHRRARIVAPAYIGRGSRLQEDTLITRYSNIESRCLIDYGTVIEDSSVLSDSYVGIWLDVCHAVVYGSKLMNLPRNVALEFADPSIIRANTIASKTAKLEPASRTSLETLASLQ
ncbi:MAG TPA: hypothetical protein VFO39_11285 [Candidatus Sulfotelmatobacter sp.]|nr:hypothetical protein [Candidatus Sulfotelmatobacter sp.]